MKASFLKAGVVSTAMVGLVACVPPNLTDAQYDRAAAVADSVDQTALQDIVIDIVIERELGLITDDYRERSADYMAAEFATAGLQVVQDISTGDGIVVKNVYADVPGQDPQLVILMAHYDALSVGADDNASGLAVLVEAARIFSSLPTPRNTLRLLAVDREEDGQVGSTRYVDRHRDDTVCAVVTLDMIGYADSTPGSQRSLFGLHTPTVADFIAVISNDPSERFALWTMELAGRVPRSAPAVGLLLPGDGISFGLGHFLRSDHAPFWLAGIPGLFFTDTADFRNPYYHTSLDRPEPLDYEFLRGSAALIIASVAAFLEDCGR